MLGQRIEDYLLGQRIEDYFARSEEGKETGFVKICSGMGDTVAARRAD